MKTMIVYFSPTGGTARVAQLIGARLHADAVDITVFDYEMSFAPEDLIFFCFPVFCERIPAPLYKRMSSIAGNGARAVMVAVFGNHGVGDALLEMSDLCKKQGFTTVAGCEMIAPHSVDKRVAAGRPDSADIAKLNAFLDKLASAESLRELKMPGNHPYVKYAGVPFRPTVGKECTGCGTCAAECPTGAIDSENPMQPDKSKCISCMRCVSVCPFENRKLPAAMKLAAALALKKLCAGRKEPRFYL